MGHHSNVEAHPIEPDKRAGQRSVISLRRTLRALDPTRAFEALASLLPDAGVFVVDSERRIVHFSEGAERLLGYTRADVEGAYCLKASRCVSCLSGCSLAERGGLFDHPAVLVHADGTEIPVRKYARAFFGGDGAFLGGVEVLTARDEHGDAGDTDAPPPARARTFHSLLTVDPVMQHAFDVVRAVAQTDTAVLVCGESGTGKELLARALHKESHRREQPFLAMSCAALSPTMLESELFGHRQGAFAGAIRSHAGIFARAAGGTLFLDEVSEIPPELQGTLARALRDRSYLALGGTRPLPVDVRLVAATHTSLRELTEQGRFREDLLQHIGGVSLALPPLRERRGDIELLLRHFIAERSSEGGRRVREVSHDAMRRLLDHTWSGNVRELQNVIDYAFAVGRGPVLEVTDLPPELRQRVPPPSGKRPQPIAHPTDERGQILEALRSAGGHVGQAAALLGMSRPTFWRKRRKHGV